MIIIGEKSTVPFLLLQRLLQKRCGVYQRPCKKTGRGRTTFIDCCASVPEGRGSWNTEMDDRLYSGSNRPSDFCGQSSADVLIQAYKFCKRPGLFPILYPAGATRSDKIFPVMAQEENKRLGSYRSSQWWYRNPENAADRLRVFDKIMAKAKEYGIAPSRIHIDPLVEMLCTSENGIETNIEVITSVREQYPSIHITAAISNISFNLPVRKLINLGFMVLAMNAGLDSGTLIRQTETCLALFMQQKLFLRRWLLYGVHRSIQRGSYWTCKKIIRVPSGLEEPAGGLCKRIP